MAPGSYNPDAMRHFTQLPPLALYIHLPWCEQKCPYCDFNSHAVREDIPENAYVDALLADLALDLPQVWGRKIETVFIGGGTPSLFSVDAINKLLSGLRALTNLSPMAEITMEANPGSAETEKFCGFREAGINRLSIGVQSFSDRCLSLLGRVHNSAQATHAVEAAQAAGFARINIDLMFALPEQTLSAAVADVEHALALQTTHLSYYQLTLEPNTLFHHVPPPLPEDDLAFDMQTAAQEKIQNAGFAQYEISAYARQEDYCQHNLNYWQFGDYLGIGAGAHGKITHPADASIRRYSKQRSPARFIATSNSDARIVGNRTVEIAETGIEFMMNAMRLIDGVPKQLFLEHTGITPVQIQGAIEKAQSAGLLIVEKNRVRPSERGLLFLNDLLDIFMNEPAAPARVIPINAAP
ncbi:MAG: radical SAM family heme chaperone HemW [Pseudomonadota bacterium]